MRSRSSYRSSSGLIWAMRDTSERRYLHFVLVGLGDDENIGEMKTFQDSQSRGHQQQARRGVMDLLLEVYS